MLKLITKLKKIFAGLTVLIQIIKAIIEAIDPPVDPD